MNGEQAWCGTALFIVERTIYLHKGQEQSYLKKTRIDLVTLAFFFQWYFPPFLSTH